MSDFVKIENVICSYQFDCGYRTNFTNDVPYDVIYDQVFSDGGFIFVSSSKCPFCGKSSLELVEEFIKIGR